MKTVVMLLLLLLTTAHSGLAAPAEGQVGASPADALDGPLAELDTRAVDDYLAGLDREIRAELPQFDIEKMVEDPAGAWVPDEMLGRLWRYLAKEVVDNARLLGQLVLLAVFCAILRGVASAFTMQGAADAAFWVVFLALLLLSVQVFRTAVSVASGAIDNMTGFMAAMLPIMITMLTAVGGITTAAVFHPLLFMVVHSVALLVKGVVLPLAFLTAALGVAGVVAKEFPMKRLAGLARQWCITLLGLLFIIFFGVLAIRGAIAPVADGLALKTAKFLTGTFVPVVGSRMAEALEVVVGGSMLLKNAIGAFGLIVVFLITAFPVLKVGAVLLIFRVATALVEPISDERLVDAMGALANSLTLVLACLLTAGLMFFVCITVLVGLGNVPAFMR